MAVPATTTNATTNATPGSPPDSTAAAPNNDNDGVDLDALRCCICDLHRMLDASADCLADTKADTAVGCVNLGSLSTGNNIFWKHHLSHHNNSNAFHLSTTM